jgi:hypothetical protein
MTREEFVGILNKEGCPYNIEGDKIVVVGGLIGGFIFGSLETIPPEVVFMNKGYVSLDLLKTISPGVEFRNNGNVFLNSLKTLPPGVVFKNGGDVYLGSLIGGYFHKWTGNIEGIDNKRLLNYMISKGMFI